jgi:hypothetical protein
MQEIRLRTFVHVDFRKNEETLFNEFLKTDYGSTLKKGEHVLFINKGDDIYQFCEMPEEWDAKNKRGKKIRVKVLASRRFRIRGSKFSPEMLSVYAARAGYRITGIKRFEWYYKEYKDAAKKAA